MKKLIDNGDDFVIEIEVKEDNDCVMDFKIVEVSGRSQDPVTKEWTIPNYGMNMYSDEFEHGDEVAHGFIKWDGCSHWYFSEYQHLCGLRNIEEFGKLPKRVFDLAAEYMPAFSIEVAS